MASTTSISEEPGTGRGARLPYLPALDGLRALAVLAVVFYHSGAKWLGGGFVGVEIFFVISGYLITSLLLAEWHTTGRIDLGQFWLRRARRLLPALFVLLAAVLALAVIVAPSEVAGLRKDAAAAAAYVTNWYLVLSQKSYFESVGRPSLLRHLWSLAVEEQFYLAWPLIFTLIASTLRPRRAVWGVLLGAVASILLMVRLYDPSLDPSRVYYGTDTRAGGLLLGSALAFVWAPGRPHFRTWWQKRRLPGGLALDAVAMLGLGLLVGACAGINEFQPSLYRGGFLLVDLATLLVVVAVVHPSARVLPALLGIAPLRWAGTRSYGIYLWHWPILMLTRPMLDVPLQGPALWALQAAAIMVVVELSFRFIERPVRQGALERAWRAWREARGERRRWLGLRWASGGLGFAFCFVLLGQSIVRAQPPAPPPYLAVQYVRFSAQPSAAGLEMAFDKHRYPDLDRGKLSSDYAASSESPLVTAVERAKVGAPMLAAEPAGRGGAHAQLLPICQAAASAWSQSDAVVEATSALSTLWPIAKSRGRNGELSANAPENTQALEASPSDLPGHRRPVHTSKTDGNASPLAEAAATPEAGQAEEPASEAQHAPSVQAPPPGDRVVAIGDSVMIAAAPLLQKVLPNLDLDARVGRQASEAIQLLRARRDADQLGQVVIVHIGNNGTFSTGQFDEMMGLLSDARRVVIVNLKVPRAWEEADNAVLVNGVKRYANALLVDWRSASIDHKELFWDDGIHLRPAGAQIYADLITAAVGAP